MRQLREMRVAGIVLEEHHYRVGKFRAKGRAWPPKIDLN